MQRGFYIALTRTIVSYGGVTSVVLRASVITHIFPLPHQKNLPPAKRLLAYCFAYQAREGGASIFFNILPEDG